MTWWLRIPGVLAGWLACTAIVVVAAPPLLRAARPRRRLAALRQPRPTQTTGAVPTTRRVGRAGARARPAGAAGVGRRRLVVLALTTLGAALVSPPLAVIVVAGGWMWPRWRAASATRRRLAAISRELPEVVDLFLVACASDLNVSLAIAAVGERGPPLFGAALRRAAADVADGARVADALDAALRPLGEAARPLASALLGTARYGAALGPALDRLAIETRQLRRRQAEEAIRRVPVKLLFPLVLLVLPAFVVLTVVPLLAGALRSLPF